jgi:hypothetical protein
MSYNTPTYTEYANRIKDWMIANATGGNITDRSLDLANRAQDWLTMYKPWSEMIKTAALTISNNQASLPDDFARVINVHWDSNSDGKPEGYFYNRGPVNKGYKITDVFSKAAGHVKTITFFCTLGLAPILEYQFKLSDFAGSGVEYSFFPGELLLKTAQRLHIVETGLVGAEMQLIISEQKTILRDYEQAHHYVDTQLRRRINDDLGNEISLVDIDLSGGDIGTRDFNRGLSRDTDSRYP